MNSLLGTCQVTVFASGKYAFENPLKIDAFPNLFRTLALYTVQNAFMSHHAPSYRYNCFTTYGFKKTVDWILSL